MAAREAAAALDGARGCRARSSAADGVIDVFNQMD
jgi:hypothetical protein